MKKMKKLTVLKLAATAVFAGCAIFGGAMISFDSKKADAEAVTSSANVQMVEGASVRIGDKAGIRFQSLVSRSYYDRQASVTAGVYLIPEDILGSATLDENTPKAMNIESRVNSSKSTDEYYLFNSVVYNIPETEYGRQLVARAYIKIGDTYEWAENEQTRSFAYVASAAIADGYAVDGTAFTDDQISSLNGYVDAAVSAFSVNETKYTLDTNETLEINKQLTAKYDDDLSDLVIKYTSDNEAVAAVDENGNLIGKTAGIATITAELGSKTDSFAVGVDGERQD